jgi:glutamate formiminotransferase / formiminotetrahydrofolate cyclodeaminase
MKRIVECVPNFSEGRDTAKIDAIIAAMREVPGVYVLDRESDADHNRSVVTLAGEPEPVAEAALHGVGKAAELIDLTKHSGAHPRMGATDVVPFIPVEGVSIEDCVALAKKVGREIWDRYKIPVYFYEAAAQRPDRANLEAIRKGQFEGLLAEVPNNPNRAPDIGNAALHPTAGATVVGARKFLVAYNINLNTSDIEIAKKIGKNIRHSNGGLRYVKAMGVDLKARNLAQVSINMTDFEQTPLHRVFEMVKREAERYGVSIVGSEIVGLIPKRAIELTADFYLQLENFSPAQVFENKIAASLSGAAPVEGPGKLAALAMPFLDAVAEPTPTPGGGSVAPAWARWSPAFRARKNRRRPSSISSAICFRISRPHPKCSPKPSTAIPLPSTTSWPLTSCPRKRLTNKCNAMPPFKPPCRAPLPFRWKSPAAAPKCSNCSAVSNRSPARRWLPI